MMRRWVQPQEANRADLLRAAVSQRLGRRLGDVSFELTPEGLLLRGQASSYYLKQMIQEAALASSGLPLLANEIQVCPSSASHSALRLGS